MRRVVPALTGFLRVVSQRRVARVSRDLIVLKYATPEGDRVFRKEVTSQALETVTAAKEVSPDNLGTVDETDVQERYAAEAERIAEKHDPDDPV